MKSVTPFTMFRVLVISVTFTFIIHPGLWVAIANGYQGDYLFNLSHRQIVGLVFITSVLSLTLFFACALSSYLLSNWMRNHTARWFNILSCTVLALLLCSVALLVVPQLHYLYYRSILPGLPAQWVPPGNLSVNTLWRYLLLPAGDNTTHHAKGVTVWISVCAAALVSYENSKADADK